jgi:RNA polymerase sigma-70 factor (ECF subfamily)
MPKVYRYVYYRIRNQQQAEDITSEVFEKAVAKYREFDVRKASFSTWIFAIAHNAVIDSYKTGKEMRQAPLEDAADLASHDPGPEEALEGREEKQKLADCVGMLPEREQEIIRLKFGARLNNRQISKLMGLSETNVGTILGRAIGKLRLSLRES